MLDWIITCHDDKARDVLYRLEKRYGSSEQCQTVSFWRGPSSNMLGHMIYHALHATNSGEGVIFLTDMTGAMPYRVASLMSHKHPQCEAISGITYPLLGRMLSSRGLLNSSAFRDYIVALGGSGVSSLQHRQQKSPPFVSEHDLCEY